MSNVVANRLTTIDGRLDGIEADFDALHGQDAEKFGGVAASARTPFRTVQSSVNTGAAVIALKAAVASKKHWITEVTFVNKTAGEYPVVELLEDEAGTPVKLDTLIPMPILAASMGEVVRRYDPPIEVTSGKSIGFGLQSTTGDVYGHARGWVED